MKTSNDPRHQKRINLMQKLFSESFYESKDKELTPILAYLTDIDTQIREAAPQWPIDKIAKVDLAILRLAVFELTQEKAVPVKVIIDEAVELAKEYGNDASSGFVNGVLGTIIKNVK